MAESDAPVSVVEDERFVTPVLPLRDVVVFPHMVIPLFVGRDKSIKALDEALGNDKQILLVSQKSAEIDDPSVADIHPIGTLATVLQLLKLPDGTVKVLVEGERRAMVHDYVATDPYFAAEISPIAETGQLVEREAEVLLRSALGMFEQYVKLNKKIPPEILTSLQGIEDLGRLADTIAAHMTLKLEEKQVVLEMGHVQQRLEHLMGLMESEVEILQMEKRIRGRVKRQMEKSQREYYLNEQMKAIQKELGELEDAPNEAEELAQKIEKAGMSKEAKAKATAELNKLKMMSPMSAEATVVRNYVDWLVSVPWKKRSASSSTWRCSTGCARSRARSCAWSVLRVSARPRSASRSPVRPAASSCACRSVGCATRPRSAATGAPTSVRCRARSSRTCPRSACATRCSCSTRSTRCRWTSVATRRRRCSRCSTRSRTTPSTTTTSRSTSTSPT
jgi:ATP-dependent Lon protease